MDVEYTINVFLIPPVSILGIIGNILQIAAHQWKSISKSPVTPFLRALAVNDILLLIVFSVIMPYHTIVGEAAAQRSDFYRLVPLLVAVGSYTFMAHIWITVSLTADRFIAVCLPIWHQTSRPKYQAVILIAASNIFAVAFSIPRYLSLQVVVCNDTVNRTYALQPTQFSKHSTYKFGYLVLAKGVLSALGPILVISGMTVCIMRRVFLSMKLEGKQSSRMPRQSNAHSHRIEEVNVSAETSLIKRTTRKSESPLPRVKLSPRNRSMKQRGSLFTTYRPLLAVLTTAILCYSLPSIQSVIEVFAVPISEQSAAVTSNISNFLVIVDASCNFYVYLANNYSYRRNIRNGISELLGKTPDNSQFTYGQPTCSKNWRTLGSTGNHV